MSADNAIPLKSNDDKSSNLPTDVRVLMTSAQTMKRGKITLFVMYDFDRSVAKS